MSSPTLSDILRARARRLDEPCQSRRRAVLEAVLSDVEAIGSGPGLTAREDERLKFDYMAAIALAHNTNRTAAERPDSLRRSQLAADALELAIRIKALMIEEGEMTPCSTQP